MNSNNCPKLRHPSSHDCFFSYGISFQILQKFLFPSLVISMFYVVANLSSFFCRFEAIIKWLLTCHVTGLSYTEHLPLVYLQVLQYVDHLHGKWHFNEIRAIFSRRYLLQNTAIEIFMASRSESYWPKDTMPFSIQYTLSRPISSIPLTSSPLHHMYTNFSLLCSYLRTPASVLCDRGLSVDIYFW